MTVVHPTFEVDKEGLAKLMSRRGPGFAVLELLQNALDEDTTTVVIDLTWVKAGRYLLRVEDNHPDGFANIAHAYTLFADSTKKTEVRKRGRFNIGEKLVIAICDTAAIETTTGTIRFDHKGRTHHPSERRVAGSVFTGLIRMTKPEFEEAARELWQVLIPDGVTVIFNGVTIESRTPVRSFVEPLTTEVADAEGILRRRKRTAIVEVHAVREGEKATLFEMGIPVVATGDRWHVDVQQKIPLNVDRDNVTPGYLRDIRRAVLDRCHDLLEEASSGEKWLDDAMSDPNITPEALTHTLDLRFGEKRVSHDPSDPEANKLAASEGYTVVPSRALSKDAWKNVRAIEAILPAGRVTPSPTPYDPNAQRVRTEIPVDDWTPGMRNFARFSASLAEHLVGVTDLTVCFVNDPACTNFRATWGRSTSTVAILEWNVRVLGRAYFDQSPQHTDPLGLLIHELGHHHGGEDHLDRKFLRELCRIGADLARLVMLEPAAFADNPPRVTA